MTDKKYYYDRFVISFIKEKFSYQGCNIDKSNLKKPLTGKEIGLNATDLLALYYALSDFFDVDMDFSDIDTFWSADSISNYLLDLDKQQIFELILSKIKTEGIHENAEIIAQPN